jgi:DnaK suppressor protein
LRNVKPIIAGPPKNGANPDPGDHHWRNPMNIETQNHLATLRDLLTYRLHDLESEVHADELARRRYEAPGDVTDRKEEAAQFAEGGVLEAQELRDVGELQQVRRALERLDAGIYGDCAECGEPIALQRLLAEPAAERCASCQAVRERAGDRAR